MALLNIGESVSEQIQPPFRGPFWPGAMILWRYDILEAERQRGRSSKKSQSRRPRRTDGLKVVDLWPVLIWWSRMLLAMVAMCCSRVICTVCPNAKIQWAALVSMAKHKAGKNLPLSETTSAIYWTAFIVCLPVSLVTVLTMTSAIGGGHWIEYRFCLLCYWIGISTHSRVEFD
jgi:hypothetical protein